ncbi:MAG: hypothetical protein ABIH71_03745, partial [Candidatus Omnitrophota bacterium]
NPKLAAAKPAAVKPKEMVKPAKERRGVDRAEMAGGSKKLEKSREKPTGDAYKDEVNRLREEGIDARRALDDIGKEMVRIKNDIARLKAYKEALETAGKSMPVVPSFDFGFTASPGASVTKSFYMQWNDEFINFLCRAADDFRRRTGLFHLVIPVYYPPIVGSNYDLTRRWFDKMDRAGIRLLINIPNIDDRIKSAVYINYWNQSGYLSAKDNDSLERFLSALGRHPVIEGFGVGNELNMVAKDHPEWFVDESQRRDKDGKIIKIKYVEAVNNILKASEDTARRIKSAYKKGEKKPQVYIVWGGGLPSRDQVEAVPSADIWMINYFNIPAIVDGSFFTNAAVVFGDKYFGLHETGVDSLKVDRTKSVIDENMQAREDVAVYNAALRYAPANFKCLSLMSAVDESWKPEDEDAMFKLSMGTDDRKDDVYDRMNGRNWGLYRGDFSPKQVVGELIAAIRKDIQDRMKEKQAVLTMSLPQRNAGLSQTNQTIAELEEIKRKFLREGAKLEAKIDKIRRVLYSLGEDTSFIEGSILFSEEDKFKKIAGDIAQMEGEIGDKLVDTENEITSPQPLAEETELDREIGEFAEKISEETDIDKLCQLSAQAVGRYGNFTLANQAMSRIIASQPLYSEVKKEIDWVLEEAFDLNRTPVNPYGFFSWQKLTNEVDQISARFAPQREVVESFKAEALKAGVRPEWVDIFVDFAYLWAWNVMKADCLAEMAAKLESQRQALKHSSDAGYYLFRITYLRDLTANICDDLSKIKDSLEGLYLLYGNPRYVEMKKDKSTLGLARGWKEHNNV